MGIPSSYDDIENLQSIARNYYWSVQQIWKSGKYVNTFLIWIKTCGDYHECGDYVEFKILRIYAPSYTRSASRFH